MTAAMPKMTEPQLAMPREGFDLDAYLDRISYNGPRAPTIDTLKALHRLHPQAIAFENLDPFLGEPVLLDANSLHGKLVSGGRGGYCFEQNLLFMDALRALGFSVSGLAARVMWNRPADAAVPRSHMLLRVAIEGRVWLADAGFGGITQTAPLLLAPGLEQETPHEPFRLMADGDHYTTQVKIGGDWRTLYRFDMAENTEPDYTVTNYFVSTHPGSHFVTGLMLARPLSDRRYALANNRLTTHHLGGGSERRDIGTAAELADTIEGLFGIALPDRAAFMEAAARKNVFGIA